MKIFNVKKGKKINTESSDSHQDGTECVILGEVVNIEAFRGLPSNKMYMVVFQTDNKFPIPIMTAGHRIEVTDEELEDFVFNDIHGNEYALNVAQQLEPAGFKFYE